jgi:hypothetical protein
MSVVIKNFSKIKSVLDLDSPLMLPRSEIEVSIRTSCRAGIWIAQGSSEGSDFNIYACKVLMNFIVHFFVRFKRWDASS